VFHEKADEQPDADIGDVIFVVSEQEHSEFTRRGADLFIERKISLVEALCGFELEVTHLDGRKLLIKSAPGDVVKPLPRGFDPLSHNDDLEWECFDGFDCPDIEDVARAQETDAEVLKKASHTELKKRGIDVQAFVVDSEGARFKHCSRTEAIAAKRATPGSKMYVVADPLESKQNRMIKAVPGEGMPTLRNPFVFGNLFLVLSIEFPDSIPIESLGALKEILPPPLSTCALRDEEDDVVCCTLSDMDPQVSQAANAANLEPSRQAYDDEDEYEPGMPQCQQM
jgi:hypothetical protein